MGNAKFAESTVRELEVDLKTPSLQHASSIESQEATGDVVGVSSPLKISKARGVTMIVTLSGISFLNTMGSGILIAALPRIANDVGLEKSLILVSFLSLLLSNKIDLPGTSSACYMVIDGNQQISSGQQQSTPLRQAASSTSLAVSPTYSGPSPFGLPAASCSSSSPWPLAWLPRASRSSCFGPVSVSPCQCACQPQCPSLRTHFPKASGGTPASR